MKPTQQVIKQWINVRFESKVIRQSINTNANNRIANTIQHNNSIKYTATQSSGKRASSLKNVTWKNDWWGRMRSDDDYWQGKLARNHSRNVIQEEKNQPKWHVLSVSTQVMTANNKILGLVLVLLQRNFSWPWVEPLEPVVLRQTFGRNVYIES